MLVYRQVASGKHEFAFFYSPTDNLIHTFKNITDNEVLDIKLILIKLMKQYNIT